MTTGQSDSKTGPSLSLAVIEHRSLAAAVENAADGIMITDIHGTIEYVNPSFTAMTGYSSEEAVGQNPHLLKSGVHTTAFYKEMWDTIRSGRVWRGELTNRRKDGTTYQDESRISPVQGTNGGIAGYVAIMRDVTERRLAEEVAKESEERFRAMADGCPMPLWITNPEGKIQFVNRAFGQFMGDSLERVMGNNWQKLIHPEDAPGFIKECLLALQEQRSFTREARVQQIDGEWRWFTAFVAPRFSPSGEFLGHVGLDADITERKRTEQALQKSEENFRQLTENIREIFWLKEPGKSEFLYISPAYEQVFGRTCASFYQNPASRLELIHPDDLERSRQVFAQQEQGNATGTEYRIRTPDGQEKWIRSRAFPVLDQAGQLVRIAGIAEEVTEQKQYEAQLIRAQAEAEAANRQLSAQHAILDRERTILRTFIDNVPDLMYVKDLESRFVIANREVARRMGVKSPEGLIGKSDFDFFAGEMARKFYEDEQCVIRSGKPMFDHEERVAWPTTNETSYLVTTKVPLFDSDNRVTGIAGMGWDITGRKRNENALRESNRQLQETTARANQLAFEAEAANRAKSEFLANMSHEIRTPMNGVLGVTGLLLDSKLEAEQRHYAELVEDSAKSLLKLIDDILDFSKVEAGKLEIDNVDFNLHVLMGDFADAMAERVSEKQLEFVCAVAPNVCTLLQGDPGRVRQVLMNLVGNAMKFTHQGEVVVRADLISETETEVSMRFSVRDTGIGIPKDKQQILFTSFTQVDASTTRQYGGSGLGLAISKKLVELMGGEIGMESKEGEGSEFWFKLSFSKQLACQQVNLSKIPMSGARILVVDDNATNREFLTAQLQSWGAAVVAAESGPAALACLRQAVAAGSPFQLAVLDMMMPGMDGATLGATVLADDTLKSTPLVMMTSFTQRGDAVRFKEIGFAAYLVKPVRQSDLFDCLAAVLNGKQQTEKRALITRHSLEVARRSSARILVVEDNLTNQEVARGVLRRMGWHADVKASGKEALEALETNAYDLVLMDVQMPEMDGYEATRMIRDSRSRVLNHQIPIIATTAHVMAGDAAKCFAAGMSDYIAKPIDPQALSKVVEKWLTRKVHSAAGESAVESECQGLPCKSPGPSLVFNREAFLERLMEDEVLAHEVVSGFVKDLPAALMELKEHVALGALEPIWKQAHKIKGSAANVGGETLRDVASEIEQAGRAGDLAKVVRCIPDLERQVSRLSEALQQWAR
jgi:PAS domain S-box-containing protein